MKCVIAEAVGLEVRYEASFGFGFAYGKRPSAPANPPEIPASGPIHRHRGCGENLHAPAETIAQAVVKAYLRGQMVQANVSPALSRVALDLDARELIELAIRRSVKAIEAALSSASDGRFADPSLVAQTLTAALYGTVPAFCHKVLSAADGIEAERQLTIMFRSYLVAHQSGVAETKG